MSYNKLVKSVPHMSFPEIRSLAQNRFISEELQMAIAKFPYPLAHEHLSNNIGLSRATRDYLWSDDCSSGYVLKTNMLRVGLCHHEPEKYRELYEYTYSRLWLASQSIGSRHTNLPRYGEYHLALT